MKVYPKIGDMIAEIESRAELARKLADQDSTERARANGRGIAAAYAEFAKLLRQVRIGEDAASSKQLQDCR